MIKSIAERRSILRFEKVKLVNEQSGGGETIDLEMNLCGGDLALINLERPRFGSMLADAGCGLHQAAEGSILFLGKDWASLPSNTANALRGRIGRVFTFGNWINRLTLLENILLPQLHHTRREFAELRDEAVRLAEHFGLPGLPTGLPDDVMRTDHQRAACIRAFLGQPSLILLEEPTFGVYPAILPPLINAIRKACDRGCGVIWLTLEDQVWNDPMLPATHRFRLTARKLMEVLR
ncbi:MAG: ATP-binding cassette domain-containing protein [Deltaproteobacteria bacterium]|jgi:phospholipid/cholesterol/gamma-HCH transport system ATP-binding protein|nr:ATP-binding cassette domain-containing protein [Deltaproteobacteria bacterium]